VLNKLLCVDPGWTATAYAYFDKDFYPSCTQYQFTCPNQDTRFKAYLNEFEYMIQKYKIETVIIEGVENWQGSLKSRTASARQDTIKLAYLVGAYKAMCAERNIHSIILTAPQWKGQLSKEATRKRVDRILEIKTTCSEHIIDAIGIGLSRDSDLWLLKKKRFFSKNKQET
jgi:Holliday junction resolvasome RuvABC endonuclease subunit